MRWDEATFWGTSVAYYYRAVDGWNKANGHKPIKSMTRSRFAEMLELDAAGLLDKYALKSELPKP